MLLAVLSVFLFASAAFAADTAMYLFVAAGLSKPMKIVAQKFEEKTGVKVIAGYASSGNCYAQIMKGQPCDLFYSADWALVEKLDKEAHKAGVKKPFLKDYVVLVAAKSAADKVTSFEKLTDEGITAAVCDLRAPVGKYAEKGLRSMGLWDKMEKNGNLKARPATVNQLAIMVQEDQIDAGLIYSSVAHLYGLNIADKMDLKHTGDILFGAVAVKGGNEKLAEEFMTFAEENIGEFTKFGWEAAK